MNESEDELTTREANAFRKLAKEKPPPAFMESRIIDALKEAQLIRNSSFYLRRRLLLTGSAIAVLIVTFTSGILFGSWWSSPSETTRGLSRFMLLLRTSPHPHTGQSANERFQRVREYSAWASVMANEGVVIGGEKLKDEVRLLNLVDGQPIVSTLAETPNDDAIGGYFLIYARDYREAIVIAENCPHLKYGGTIEIRQIDSVARSAN